MPSIPILMNDGSYLTTSVIRINSIPLNSVLKEIRPEESVHVYRTEFSRFLSEFHQWASSNFTNIEDCSLELTWITNEAVNQTYIADIELYVVIRTIGNENDSLRTNDLAINLFNDLLSFLKYDHSQIDLADYLKKINGSNETCNAIVKSEIVERSNVPTLDAIYTFGHIPDVDVDFSSLVNHLTKIPKAIIHFQVIPTRYTANEKNLITNYYQSANIASKGIMARGVGQVSFSQAEYVQSAFQPYYNQRSGPLYKYSIIIRSDNNNVNSVASQVIGLLNSDPEKPVNFDIIHLDKSLFQGDRCLFTPWTVFQNVWKIRTTKTISFGNMQVGSQFRQLPCILTISETSAFFRLPIGSDTIRSGLNVNESDMTSRKYVNKIIDSADIEIGSLCSSKNKRIGLNINDLTKHMFICGTPGSGKTSFSIGLLDRMWKSFHIPFLVIEPAKTEYRTILNSIPDLQIFTPGKDGISPFVFNPFKLPTNVGLESYKNTLHTAFSASATMTSPLDIIFDEAVENCYSEHRWLDTYREGDGGETFNIAEFVKTFRNTFERIGYVGEASNIGRAGIVRMSKMTRLFDTYSSIPIEDLLSKPTVIELAAIEDRDLKALYMALILLSILSYVNSNYDGDGQLKNLILIEEAHVLLDSQQNINNKTDADPSAISQTLVQRMLAESRAYGLGMIIADQSPRKVGLDVIAMTDCKIAFRVVESNDKQIIGNSINLDESQMSRLSKLRPGEAFFFFQKIDVAEEVKITDYRSSMNLPVWVPDQEVSKRSRYWNEHKELLRPYPECSIKEHCDGTCNRIRRITAKQISKHISQKVIQSNNLDVLKSTIHNMHQLVMDELGGEPCSDELFYCVKVHFWREMEYNSSFSFTDGTIEKMIGDGCQ